MGESRKGSSKPCFRRQGSILVITALSMVLLLSVTSLVVDVGFLMGQRRMLQNAADASALAGVRELAQQRPHRVDGVIADYLAFNGIDEEELLSVTTDMDSVTVVLRGGRALFFARALGMTETEIQVEATAQVASLGGMGGLIPVGIPESVYRQALEDQVGVSIISFQMSFGSGNWGWISFDGKGSDFNPNTMAVYIESGYPEVVFVGDPIDTRTGTLNPRMRQAMDDHIFSGTVLYAPVVTDGSLDGGSGGTKVHEILGFAAVVLTGRSGNPSETTITADIVPHVAVGEGTRSDLENFGMVGISLVR